MTDNNLPTREELIAAHAIVEALFNRVPVRGAESLRSALQIAEESMFNAIWRRVHMDRETGE